VFDSWQEQHTHHQQAGGDKQKMRPGSWFGQCFVLPSVLLHYWLGNSKNIQLIKTTCFFLEKVKGKLRNWLTATVTEISVLRPLLGE